MPAQSSAIRLALTIIIAHAVVVSLHAAAHQILGIQASTAQLFFIITVIMLAPPVAGILLWKRMKTAGAILFASSMAGAMLFGIYYHFVEISPDHVSLVGAMPQKFWAFMFQLSAALLALIEACGVWAGIRMLKKV